MAGIRTGKTWEMIRLELSISPSRIAEVAKQRNLLRHKARRPNFEHLIARARRDEGVQTPRKTGHTISQIAKRDIAESCGLAT